MSVLAAILAAGVVWLAVIGWAVCIVKSGDIRRRDLPGKSRGTFVWRETGLEWWQWSAWSGGQRQAGSADSEREAQSDAEDALIDLIARERRDKVRGLV